MRHVHVCMHEERVAGRSSGYAEIVHFTKQMCRPANMMGVGEVCKKHKQHLLLCNRETERRGTHRGHGRYEAAPFDGAGAGGERGGCAAAWLRCPFAAAGASC